MNKLFSRSFFSRQHVGTASILDRVVLMKSKVHFLALNFLVVSQVSDSPEFLQRTFMSPAALRAGQLIRTWMSDAGLFT